MPKLIWVGLPLLLFLAVVAVRALQRRPLSRPAFNAWSSLLLLGYVLATASLGIFWVANQQLPVFDWHYLFGYATVLLVVVHLSFNLRAAWRTLFGLRPAAPAESAAGSRRGVLATLGVLAATGIGFAFGLRQRRDEMPIAAPSGGGAGAVAAGLAVVEQFHALSSHSRAGVLLRAPGADWADPPPSFKRYPQAARIELPAAGPTSGGPLDLATLATLLWHTSGVSESRGGLQLRTSPSSGALFSTELYLASRALAGLPPGLWHYDAEQHALSRLAGEMPDGIAPGALGGTAPADAAALVVATAVFGRTGHKYRDRAYRYVLADLGHALENLSAAGRACGVEVQLLAAFDEQRIAATLGIDERSEGVLALLALRSPPARLPGEAHGFSGEARGAAPPAFAGARFVPVPLDPTGSPPRITAAIHAATSLRGARPAASAPAPVGAAAAPAALALPIAAAPPVDVLGVIAARRSVRRFADQPLPRSALADVLAGLTGAGSAPLFGGIRVSVVALAVESLPLGAYHYQATGHALVRSRDTSRATARAAALDQDVIGDAAAVFVLSVDRALIAADDLGPARGYRHAFLEAGRIGERVYLEAGARGLAACGVGAFYDDEAAALVGVDPAREWVVHFAALGLPAQ